MNENKILIKLLGSAWLLFASLALGVTQDVGKIKFADMTHDFGRVKRGEKLTFRFDFQNLGKGPLSFQGVHATCGCMVVNFVANKVYAPGESGFVDVTLDTTNFRGHVGKSVTVMPSESQYSAVNLNVKAFVEEELFADPPIIVFGDVSSPMGANERVRVKAVGNEPLVVSEITYNKETLDVSYVKEGDVWFLSVTLLKNLHSGFFRDTIYVQNNSKSLPSLPILVRANIKGSIAYSPNYLEFGAISKQNSSKREIVLEQSAEHSITSSKIELKVNGDPVANPDELIEVLPEKQGPLSPAGKRRVQVILKNKAGTTNYGSVHGRIIFDTSDPNQEKLPVDFYAFFL